MDNHRGALNLPGDSPATSNIVSDHNVFTSAGLNSPAFVVNRPREFRAEAGQILEAVNDAAPAQSFTSDVHADVTDMKCLAVTEANRDYFGRLHGRPPMPGPFQGILKPSPLNKSALDSGSFPDANHLLLWPIATHLEP